MIKQILHDNWTVRAAGDRSEVPGGLREIVVPARVPGCVHTDLLRAGKIPDPYQDLNEHKLQWIGHTDWQYRTIFHADEQLFTHERIDLVFDGLDTVAYIELNGSIVAETFNMHRGYRFDVRKSLKRGENELVITFASPVRYAERMQEKLGARPYCNSPAGPFNFIRKMACNFGWDWGPALPTSGIWRGVKLEGWQDRSGVRITSVLPHCTLLDDGSAELVVVVNFDGDEEAALVNPVASAELSHPDDPSIRQSELIGFGKITWRFTSLKPLLWWPLGHGQQNLYQFNVEIGDDRIEARIGLRTVELDTSPDDIGSKFVLKVNNKSIFCKGFNWIPDDCFLDRAMEPARVRQRIQQAVDAGANMLRVWGGGIFETDEFYDICDEMGVLVWQDFLFACAMYPEEEPFRSEVEAEARYNVARLAHHPSLAIWNGCNENIWAYRDWGWKDQLKDAAGGQRTWGLNYYLDLLPRIVKELTPTIPYWAASPWSGDPDPDNGVHPNADTHGNMHVWKPWNHANYDAYREFQPRFASEFGFQGPATFASIASVVPANARDFGGAEMRHRQKSGDRVRDDGDRKNLRHLIEYFNLPGAQELYDALEPPDKGRKLPDCGCEPVHPANSLPSQVNFDELHYLLQVNQARALTLGVEWFRSRQPRCMGTLYWQLNDCWPGATSWSCIDGDGRKKPLWYATRKFFADVLWTFQPEPDGSLALYVINDTDESHDGPVMILRSDFDGRTLAEQKTRLNVPPRSVGRVKVEAPVATPSHPTREMLSANIQPIALWFFAPDKSLNYPRPAFEADWSSGKLAIRAKSLLRDVCVFVDRLDPAATVSEQLVTLLPDESFTFEIKSKLPLTKEQLTSPPVFRCVNPFGVNAL
ncbi:MAG: beta-mannosidase [Phycisphaerales bacterium]|jgi:beta-mannosidase|nr:beta-mannosidase [Phycisphaerales bacterium]